MGEQTSIAWTDATFNPWWGCQRVSPGCEHCYAEAFSKRVGMKLWGPAADRRFFGDKHWAEPRAWNRRAGFMGARTKVFCASMADVFEDRRDLDGERARLWALIEETPHLDWQLLTKRPEHMLRLAPARWADSWPDNVWAGCTAEDQAQHDKRWPLLARVPARVLFLSHEPALGPLRLHEALDDTDSPCSPEWVITGGESGGGARPYDIAWARALIAQTSATDTALFVKQLGARPTTGGVPMAHPLAALDRKWERPEHWPEDLRVREFPGEATL